jgi:elongation factor P--(R)-beta-lysine ligase
MSWRPTADLHHLKLRSDTLWKIRCFLHDHGLAEVQTPVLSCDTVVDRHLDPIRVPAANLELGRIWADGICRDEFYLQTSPEFAMKRLLAAGSDAIYQICPVFRAGERGDLHNPEFTMVEWYRVGWDFQAGIDFLIALLTDALGLKHVEQLSYQSAFAMFTGVDPFTASQQELVDRATRQLDVGADFSQDRDDWLHLMFDGLVQPHLGRTSPVVITHYPSSQSALARLARVDPRTAERFELFICGVELANGYHELTDPAELLERNRAANQARKADGKGELPEDSRLMEALGSGMPECSGCALGLDRLLMILAGAQRIDQVMAFPIERS